MSSLIKREKGGKSLGIRFIKIAGVYFVLAVILGLVMGIIQNFAFASVHAHLNLLGWVSMALFGLIYSVYKRSGETALAKTHFWLHNIGLPIMQGSLFIELLTGNTSLTIGIIIGSLIVVLGVLLFVLNLFLSLREG